MLNFKIYSVSQGYFIVGCWKFKLCHFLFQGIFPTQGLKPGLLHCRQTLYCLSHQGSKLQLNRVRRPEGGALMP